MSGFFYHARRSFMQNNIRDFLKEISNFGITDKAEIIKNSHSIGYNEDNIIQQMGAGLDEYEFLNLLNNSANKYLPFFDQKYQERRPFLRAMAKEPEIENILTILCDECIVYDDNSYFCTIKDLPTNLKNHKTLQENLLLNFKTIYEALGFKDLTSAWWIFFKFLVDGFLAYEIIYNEEGKKIIGFKEIDPVTLQLGVDEKNEQVWIQFAGDSVKQRVLYDTQIIYISYSSSTIEARSSYLERLIKPYNIMKIIEQTRVTWSVVNASFRLKFLIPIGGKSKNQAQQTLRKLMHRYNEEITFDGETGQYHINGKPYLPGVKQIWLPEKNGESPTVETLGGDGPDLNDTDQMSYFRNNFKEASKIPFSRFDKSDSGGLSFDNSSSQITQDEMRFNRFIIRLRSIFKEIIVKPLRLQMILDNENLKDDVNFRNYIDISFHKYNLFEEMKMLEIEKLKMEHIERMSGLTDSKGIPFFDMEWLVKKYNLITDEDFKSMEKLKEQNTETEEDDLEVDPLEKDLDKDTYDL